MANAKLKCMCYPGSRNNVFSPSLSHGPVATRTEIHLGIRFREISTLIQIQIEIYSTPAIGTEA